jgi:hypothetical protein
VPRCPRNTKVIPEQRLVTVRFAAVLSFGDIEGYAAALRTDPLFDSGFSEIVDLTGVVKIEMNAQETMRLADVVDPFDIGAKRAFVAQTELQIHAARMHHLLRDATGKTQICSSLADARKWIES